ncbi:hypothetical protein TNCV_3953421 [Trichonephila clavipes]|nr:hypothetical protein TNCV_3953421 [Trichonephila clavipes]
MLSNLPIHSEPILLLNITSALTPVKDINTSPVAPLRKRGRPRKVTSTSQNKHFPSPSTATTAVSNRTSIPQQELLLQQLIMSPRRDVVGSIGEIVTPVV